MLKMNKRISHIFITILLSVIKLQSAEVVMSESDFLKIVGKNHPLAKQANLHIQKGKSTILKASGAFDPVITTQYDNKTFEDKRYYEILSSGLKIPLWFGPDINFAYQSSSGNYLNPENNLPEDGLISAGIKVPLGQGLFIDNRRATFKQAEIFEKLSAIEQIRFLADLYYDAIDAYWKWSAGYMKLQLNDDILNVAYQRFDGIKQSFVQGDIPAIDTLEAYLQVLNFDMNLQSAKYEYYNSGLKLSNFLWDENLVPLEINDNLIPLNNYIMEVTPIDSIKSLANNIDSLVNIHPELEVYNLKLENLMVERRLKSEYLKPKLELKYDYLNNAIDINANQLYPEANYKIGIDFKMPIFLRNERGDIQLTDIKIAEAEYQTQSKRLEIKNKINSYFYEIEMLSSNFKLFTIALQNYRKLFEAEQIKFNAGESSLFLLNSRENSLLNARLKQIDLFAKINLKYAALRWSLGTLGRGE